MKFSGSQGGLLFASFNQDYTRLTVGTSTDYRIYRVNEGFDRLLHMPEEGASIVQMLYNTSLVAQVGAGEDASSSRRCLRMINTKRKKEIVRMNYRTVVLAVKLNRSRLVLVLETDIYIYDISNMKLIHVINSTPKNKDGVCALASCHVEGDTSSKGCHNLLAYPGSDSRGEIYIYDTVNLRLVEMIEAHKSVVTSLEFNNRGDLLATASGKGTVFRIFATPSGQKLFELRRGFATYASVSSMCFSLDSRFFSISSDKATVHVFKLETTPEADDSSWSGYLTSGLTSVASMLPSAMTEVWTQSRSFAQVQLEKPVANLAALISNPAKEMPELVIVTEQYEIFRFDVPSEGGECTKIKTLNLNSVEAAPQTPASYAAAAGADDTDEAAAAMGGES